MLLFRVWQFPLISAGRRYLANFSVTQYCFPSKKTLQKFLDVCFERKFFQFKKILQIVILKCLFIYKISFPNLRLHPIENVSARNFFYCFLSPVVDYVVDWRHKDGIDSEFEREDYFSKFLQVNIIEGTLRESIHILPFSLTLSFVSSSAVPSSTSCSLDILFSTNAKFNNRSLLPLFCC